MKILEVDEHRYPLKGSRIHHQGETDYVAVGPEEIARLNKRQQRGLQRLVESAKSDTGVTAVVDISSGDLLLNNFCPMVARVTREGRVEKLVQWL